MEFIKLGNINESRHIARELLIKVIRFQKDLCLDMKQIEMLEEEWDNAYDDIDMLNKYNHELATLLSGFNN